MELPKDIPYRKELIEAGFTNYGVLRNHKCISTIRGLGAKGEKVIREYWKNPKKKSSSDYSISELREMDLSDKDESFFEGDERSTVEKIK